MDGSGSNPYILSSTTDNGAQSTATVIGAVAISDADGMRFDTQDVATGSSLQTCQATTTVADSDLNGILDVTVWNATPNGTGTVDCSDISTGDLIKIGSEYAIASTSGPTSGSTATLSLLIKEGAAITAGDDIATTTISDGSTNTNVVAYNNLDTGAEIATWISSSTDLNATYDSSAATYTVWASTTGGGMSVEITDWQGNNASNTADDLKLGLKYGGTEAIGVIPT
jgi:hypothetical protein